MNKGVPLRLPLLGLAGIVPSCSPASSRGAGPASARALLRDRQPDSMVEMLREIVNNARRTSPAAAWASICRSWVSRLGRAGAGVLLCDVALAADRHRDRHRGARCRKLGFGLRCIQQNEDAARTWSVSTPTRYKTIAFGLSAVFVGAAGGLYAAWVHYIDPSDVFDILLSVKPLVMVLMGGHRHRCSVVVLRRLRAISAFEEVVWRNFLPIHSGVLGVLIILLVLFLPQWVGVAGERRGLFGRKAKRDRDPRDSWNCATPREASGGLKARERRQLSAYNRGEMVGLIGPNGAGKTTLINLITAVHSGKRRQRRISTAATSRGCGPTRSARLGLSRTFQIVQPFPEFSVLENVAAGALFSPAGRGPERRAGTRPRASGVLRAARLAGRQVSGDADAGATQAAGTWPRGWR